MIQKVTRGNRMRGLLYYQFGPGDREEHSDQHVVATSPGIDVPIGRELTAGELYSLGTQLEMPKVFYDVDVAGGHVWHLSLSLRADDRVLSDEEWADIAREAMARVGFDDGTKPPTPWVAVRHGMALDTEGGERDHLHMAVSIVREDGTVASRSNDYRKVGAACRDFEQRYGLTVVAGRHTSTTTKWPNRPERERAQRDPDAPAPEPGGPKWTPTQELAIVVRGVAASSGNEADFVVQLHRAGYQVRPRAAPGDASKVAGYSVRSITGDDRSWRAGGKLAKDLSLPRLRAQWAARGGASPVDERAAWRSPDRPTPPTTRPQTPGRDQVRPATADTATSAPGGADAALEDALAEIRRITAGVNAGDVNPDDVANPAGALAAGLSVRLDGERAGHLADVADQLTRRAAPASSGGRDYVGAVLAAAAMVALQSTQLAKKTSTLILVMELVHLASAVAERRQAERELAAVRRLRARYEPGDTTTTTAASEQIHAATAATRGEGTRQRPTRPSSTTPPPPPPPGPRARPAGGQPSDLEAQRLRERRHRRDHGRGR
ncbi:MAG: relaxase/mobilization nuclease domain-containing protein [Desertimonas sp.]